MLYMKNKKIIKALVNFLSALDDDNSDSCDCNEYSTSCENINLDDNNNDILNYYLNQSKLIPLDNDICDTQSCDCDETTDETEDISDCIIDTFCNFDISDCIVNDFCDSDIDNISCNDNSYNDNLCNDNSCNDNLIINIDNDKLNEIYDNITNILC